MIWAENVPTIVMLTHLIEKNKVCELVSMVLTIVKLFGYTFRSNVISTGRRMLLIQWTTMVSLSLSWRKIPLLIMKFVNSVLPW